MDVTMNTSAFPPGYGQVAPKGERVSTDSGSESPKAFSGEKVRIDANVMMDINEMKNLLYMFIGSSLAVENGDTRTGRQLNTTA
jgi:hypothetical protein